ncbi:hypothetical protein TUZN_0705 [Thermoproteus uzoniensis 768-20]|uniref:Ribonuclease VapC n=1 Tax=Thermoproteus uzoniensis (strain 768-20) TaxID=999630 RepID=F2L4L7_THEU7|nr:type II toxin-antitoxin system VapC family toxin [Thermoproteus uzoniensis]AEA12195.1 hypothetical protein TUZN_0705 [Thermoproteus uzoniensis 768-20]
MEIAADASAIAALFLPEDKSAVIEKLFGQAEAIHTLDLAAYEVLNAVWKYARRGVIGRRLAEEIETELLDLLRTLYIHRYEEVLPDALKLALEKDVTVYDAAYVALAQKLGAPLLTLDRRLAEEFPRLAYMP